MPLQRVLAPPSLTGREPLDGGDLAAVGLDGEDLQLFTLTPSRWTVQAPQLLVSQPIGVPVRPSRSRR